MRSMAVSLADAVAASGQQPAGAAAEDRLRLIADRADDVARRPDGGHEAGPLPVEDLVALRVGRRGERIGPRRPGELASPGDQFRLPVGPLVGEAVAAGPLADAGRP